MHPQTQSMLKQCIQAFQDGNFDLANAMLNKVLQTDINSANTIFELGITFAKVNRFTEALTTFSSLRPYKKSDARIPYNLGLIYSLQGKHQHAIESYDAALILQPDDVETLINKGSTCNDIRNYVLALEVLENAIRINPDIPEAWSNKGIALNNLNLYQESLSAYNKAIELNPSYFEAWSNKSIVLNNLKRFSEASEACDKALSLKPDYAEAWSNKAHALHELKRYDEAIAHFDRALSLKPDYAEAWSNKGSALYGLKRFDEAIVHFDRAIILKSDILQAWSNKAHALHELKRYDEAIAHYDRALSLKPDYAEAWSNKGIVLYDIARILDAKLSFEKALELKPDFHRARWGKLFTLIPVIFLGNENLEELRRTLYLELEQLNKWFLDNTWSEAHEVIGSIQPFYLAYQDFNNKELLDRYGQLCYRLMNNWQKAKKLRHGINKGNEKIKVGVIGEQIRNHSVWNAITKGLIFNLDASKFEVHIFHLGSTIDEETHAARIKAASFTNNQTSLLEWAKVVIEKNIDVLLYPEIGMNALTTQLACLRLAPIQIASWGHPQTTGLPTIDYYLSAELFENEYSQEAYSETLVKLPSLGCNYSKLPIIAAKFDLNRLGISSDQPILICPGTPFKYDPQHDWILVEIVKRLGKCKLIFFNHENISFSEILKVRLEKVFNEANLVFNDYFLFVPWLKPEDFYGLMKRADVFLDTIGFSGFNTAMQAIECALPIVTREGRFMRGRLASGILKKIRIPELIASSDEEYIELVIQLVLDKSYRDQIAKKIIETRETLYDDIEPIHAFEKFLLSKTTHSKQL
jgi:predicted O-linked N-acetylglucosamine transferase (SPINDLY family)